jgi:hypothetical protein
MSPDDYGSVEMSDCCYFLYYLVYSVLIRIYIIHINVYTYSTYSLGAGKYGLMLCVSRALEHDLSHFNATRAVGRWIYHREVIVYDANKLCQFLSR